MFSKIIRAALFAATFLNLPFHLPAQNKPAPADKLSPEAAQRLHAAEDTLSLLAFAVVNDSVADMRFLACQSLITKLVRALKTENSFRYSFDRMQSVSILAPPDSSFRIFTWQLFVNDSTHRYYGAIQMNRRDLKLFPLIDRSFEMDAEPPSRVTLPPDRWYGALYYHLLPFETKEGPKYLLFGFDGYTFFEKRKVLDVLSFDKQGNPVFGAAVFDRTNNPQKGELRMFLEYSAEAKVRFNWDEQYKMILFDHLIPIQSPYTKKVTYVPDGSYDGFKLEKGRWVFQEKVFRDAMEKEFRPEPVFERQQGINILGTPGKPQKRKE